MDQLLAGHGYAKAAVDTAVLDLLGPGLGVRPRRELLPAAIISAAGTPR